MASITLGHRGRRRPSLRRALMVMCLLLLPLVVMEVGIRVLISSDRLVVAASHDPALELTWMDLQRAGHQDIILFGDSLIQQGIDPRVLADALGDPEHPLHVFDLASSGGRMGVNRALARELGAEGRAPRVAIIGLSPIGLRTDATWTDAMSQTPMGRLFTDCQPATAIGQQIDCRAEEVSALWRWHGRLGQIYQAIRTGQPVGRHLNGRDLRTDGFRANPSATAADLEGQMTQALAGEPVHLEAGADAALSLAGLVADLREAGVTPVVVAVPFSPLFTDALVARDPQWEQERAAAIATLSEQAGIDIIDPVRFGAWWTPASSFDVKHLSTDGARAFTGQLLEMPAFAKAVRAGLAPGGGAGSPAP
jgi:hypothetical protein